ncbi:MAG: hypothetical protein ABI305_09610, partial [Tepidiformaceae bacterium]
DRRVRAAINLGNPLGGLDLLLHGSDRLRGWGTTALPDPILYNVHSFDPVAKRFNYNVNTRFGSTRASSSTLRVPFRVTLDFTIDFSTPTPVQMLTRSLAPGRSGHSGVRSTPGDIAKRYARIIPNVYEQLLQESDSLLLTRSQVAALAAADTSYTLKTDSMWSALGAYLAALPDNYDARAALARTQSATDSVWEVVFAQTPIVMNILSPVQRTMMPFLVQAILMQRRKFQRG